MITTGSGAMELNRNGQFLRSGASAVREIVGKINVVGSIADEVMLIMRIARAERPLIVSFVNQHVVTLAWKSPDFAANVLASDMLLRDGVGVEVCLSSLNRQAGRNMNGTDFIPRLAVAFAGRRVALFGTREPWTSQAAAAVALSGCDVVALMDGFRPVEEYVEEVRRSQPALILLAMGNPKQEEVAGRIAASAGAPMTIVNGGAIADFLAQRFRRAPLWLQRLRCEWVFRLLQEPGRLWRRYVLGGFTFARCVWLLKEGA